MKILIENRCINDYINNEYAVFGTRQTKTYRKVPNSIKLNINGNMKNNLCNLKCKYINYLNKN